LASAPTPITGEGFLLSEPGSRYDVVIDFKGLQGKRIIMENIGGDEPFGGEIPGTVLFNETNRIMAFDVVTPLSNVDDPMLGTINFGPEVGTPTRTRKVALFEGKDEFGRLQPLLGTAEPATDFQNPPQPINWPATPEYQQAVFPDGTPSPLIGQMEGSIAWHSPTTENPAEDDTEEWEIWNVTGDAHPVHLHLVHFEILEREDIVWDSNTIEAGDELMDGSIATEDDETRVIPNAKAASPAGDGTYLVTQPTVQHNSVAGDPTTYGTGFKIMGHTLSGSPSTTSPPGYVENAPKDMVTALPDQVTRIKATFDKPGRYVWHCHILSHEDHEMMRVLHVGPGA
jgi:FtsP/CotA-like multicopper oxidase with cupredoxin domain